MMMIVVLVIIFGISLVPYFLTQVSLRFQSFLFGEREREALPSPISLTSKQINGERDWETLERRYFHTHQQHRHTGIDGSPFVRFCERFDDFGLGVGIAEERERVEVENTTTTAKYSIKITKSLFLTQTLKWDTHRLPSLSLLFDLITDISLRGEGRVLADSFELKGQRGKMSLWQRGERREEKRREVPYFVLGFKLSLSSFRYLGQRAESGFIFNPFLLWGCVCFGVGFWIRWNLVCVVCGVCVLFSFWWLCVGGEIDIFIGDFCVLPLSE